VTSELGVDYSRIEATALCLLQVGAVGEGVASLYGTFTVDEFALECECFGKSGLAATRAANDSHVAEVLSLISFHFFVLLVMLVAGLLHFEPLKVDIFFQSPTPI
jgi:hypothetical protein